MRDTHEGMPEPLAAFKQWALFRDGSCPAAGDARDIEFGAPFGEYQALRRIFQSRRSIRLPGLRYRYFIDHAIGRTGEGTARIAIRIEQRRGGRQFPFEGPLVLGSERLLVRGHNEVC